MLISILSASLVLQTFFLCIFCVVFEFLILFCFLFCRNFQVKITMDPIIELTNVGKNRLSHKCKLMEAI